MHGAGKHPRGCCSHFSFMLGDDGGPQVKAGRSAPFFRCTTILWKNAETRRELQSWWQRSAPRSARRRCAPAAASRPSGHAASPQQQRDGPSRACADGWRSWLPQTRRPWTSTRSTRTSRSAPLAPVSLGAGGTVAAGGGGASPPAPRPRGCGAAPSARAPAPRPAAVADLMTTGALRFATPDQPLSSAASKLDKVPDARATPSAIMQRQLRSGTPIAAPALPAALPVAGIRVAAARWPAGHRAWRPSSCRMPLPPLDAMPFSS